MGWVVQITRLVVVFAVANPELRIINVPAAMSHEWHCGHDGKYGVLCACWCRGRDSQAHMDAGEFLRIGYMYRLLLTSLF